MGWRSPEAPRGHQRRGYSDRTSEHNRDLVYVCVVSGAKGDENPGLRRPRFLLGIADGLGHAKGFRSRAATVLVVLTLAMPASRR